ncbi:MAG: hypothetical protein ABIF09_18630 [Gemmatimonadota bacterium]
MKLRNLKAFRLMARRDGWSPAFKRDQLARARAVLAGKADTRVSRREGRGNSDHARVT